MIGVIAILMSIALPALQTSKAKAQEVLCASNLRQINMAVSIYSQENESYPYGFDSSAAFNYIGDSTQDWQKGWWWFRFLDDFHEGDKDPVNIDPLWCPSRSTKSTELSSNVLCSNYGINYAICKITLNTSDEFKGTPLRDDQIHSASSTLLVMDAGYALASWKMFAEDTSTYSFEKTKRQSSYYIPGLKLNKSLTLNDDQEEDAIEGRHGRKKINAAFVDGHVVKKAASDLAPSFDAQGVITQRSVWAP